MIQFQGVSKVYPNGVVALNEIDLSIEKGEFVFMVGPSGAGKTTFIKLVIRRELPNQGQIYIGRKNLARMKEREIPRFRRNIGVIFQDYKLLPNKTVFENVSFALEVIEASRREIMRQVPAVLELVGLKDKANVFPQELSGGEQQRVSLARSIVNRPLLLLADEPTGNLDPDTSWGIMDLLMEINKRGTTIVMATHNKSIVDRMRRRVIAMENGKITRDEQKGVYGLEG
ncbi:cell division transport system ATP-binding protein [Hydrogenispora ethanolica]|uniref:Cell division ATP-binding protein FtsE n=1 Tax=Hydrogenispora ethanolica TaxID=1082276 RepID=A0A4R1QNL9_HYDET|nr:cell division ATP-binding protein FtsE [Hydrogenispora ethanolica]TCL55359.1 cell division transport system ATP-binding protein [Hydrogenispora ethanolica]